MTVSVKDKRLIEIAAGRVPKRFPADMIQPTRRALTLIVRAHRVEDLAIPPGNRLEALKGDRKGQWSIRVNDRWRLCFRWSKDGAEDVELVDYH